MQPWPETPGMTPAKKCYYTPYLFANFTQSPPDGADPTLPKRLEDETSPLGDLVFARCALPAAATPSDGLSHARGEQADVLYIDTCRVATVRD